MRFRIEPTNGMFWALVADQGGPLPRATVSVVTADEFDKVAAERDKLREAIRDAGFQVMQTSGKWSIHDVSELAKRDEERTAQVILENIELTASRERLRAACEGLMRLPTNHPISMTPDERQAMWAAHEFARAALQTTH